MKLEKISLLDLKPAQFAVGLFEVEHKMKDYDQMTSEQFHKYTEKHPVPVVKSNHGNYIIDHHHLCKAYHELGHKFVFIYYQADFSQFNEEDFWKLMAQANWVWSYDQFGEKRPVHQLPVNIRAMSDDPYRSLVWKLRENGVITKENVPFSEFKLANKLRNKIEIKNTVESFNQAVIAASDIIKSNSL